MEECRKRERTIAENECMGGGLRCERERKGCVVLTCRRTTCMEGWWYILTTCCDQESVRDASPYATAGEDML